MTLFCNLFIERPSYTSASENNLISFNISHLYQHTHYDSSDKLQYSLYLAWRWCCQRKLLALALLFWNFST